MSLCFSIILLKYPMIFVMIILFALSLIEIMTSIKLYKLVINRKESDNL